MTNLKLNETPIRTAKNYGINNIKLENINVPENISEFNGLKIKGVSNDGKITLKENICKNDFKYGNGDILSKQIEEKSNKNSKKEEIKKKDETIRRQNIQIEGMLQALLHAKKQRFGRSSEHQSSRTDSK